MHDQEAAKVRIDSMRNSPILNLITPVLIFLSLAGCHKHDGEPELEHHKIVATSGGVKNVIITQQYVCQIHSRRHINVCALEGGYLQEIRINEGQAVRQGD